MSASKLASITGVLPALVTPFDENENFDEGRMRAVVDFLIGRGIDGLYVTGSTGEPFMMSPDERKRALEVVIDETKGRVPVIAHVGAISTYHSSDLARHAEAVDQRRTIVGGSQGAIMEGRAAGPQIGSQFPGRESAASIDEQLAGHAGTRGGAAGNTQQ